MSGDVNAAAEAVTAYLEATPCEGHFHDPKCELRRAAFRGVAALAAEVESLRASEARQTAIGIDDKPLIEQLQAERERLRAENDNLTAEIVEWERKDGEVELLRAERDAALAGLKMCAASEQRLQEALREARTLAMKLIEEGAEEIDTWVLSDVGSIMGVCDRALTATDPPEIEVPPRPTTDDEIESLPVLPPDLLRTDPPEEA